MYFDFVQQKFTEQFFFLLSFDFRACFFCLSPYHLLCFSLLEALSKSISELSNFSIEWTLCTPIHTHPRWQFFTTSNKKSVCKLFFCCVRIRMTSHPNGLNVSEKRKKKLNAAAAATTTLNERRILVIDKMVHYAIHWIEISSTQRVSWLRCSSAHCPSTIQFQSSHTITHSFFSSYDFLFDFPTRLLFFYFLIFFFAALFCASEQCVLPRVYSNEANTGSLAFTVIHLSFHGSNIV